MRRKNSGFRNIDFLCLSCIKVQGGRQGGSSMILIFFSSFFHPQQLVSIRRSTVSDVDPTTTPASQPKGGVQSMGCHPSPKSTFVHSHWANVYGHTGLQGRLWNIHFTWVTTTHSFIDFRGGQEQRERENLPSTESDTGLNSGLHQPTPRPWPEPTKRVELDA